jgi:hypothetical protein
MWFGSQFNVFGLCKDGHKNNTITTGIHVSQLLRGGSYFNNIPSN